MRLARLGKICSAETKAKISSTRLGQPSPRRGAKLSFETKAKLRAANIGKQLLPSTRAKMRLRTGAKAGNWKGGITSVNHGFRRAIAGMFEYRQWRSDIFTRDNFTCQKCWRQGGELHAHHKKRFQVIIDQYKITTMEQAAICAELWDINNGITLCVDCHKGIS